MLQDAVRVKHFGTPGRHWAWEFSDSLRSAYLRSAAGKTVERTSRSAQPRWTVTITEPPPLAEKPPQPASAARLPLCASPRPRSGARRSRRVRAASLPSAHGVGRERCARDVAGDAHDHLVARARTRPRRSAKRKPGGRSGLRWLLSQRWWFSNRHGPPWLR